jgi:hypothetical protein
MQFGINLLRKKEIATTEEKEITSKLKKIIVITLVIYTLIVVGLIGSQLFLSREKQKITSQASQLELRIKSYQTVESLEVLIKDRIEKCANIIGSRTHPEIILAKIINAKGEGVEITSVELEKNHKVKLAAESEDVGSLEKFTNEIKAVFSGEGYQTVILESVSRTKDGGYSLNLVAQK